MTIHLLSLKYIQLFDFNFYFFSYLAWPFQPLVNQKTSETHPAIKTKKSLILNSKKQSIVPIHKQEKDALTLHVHTHHHHHIHNSNSSSLLKPLNPTTVPLSTQDSSSLVDKEQLVETKTILPLSVTTEHQLNGTIKKTTRRKSSPVKRHINGGIKSDR
jgi:hypothetical protein